MSMYPSTSAPHADGEFGGQSGAVEGEAAQRIGFVGGDLRALVHGLVGADRDEGEHHRVDAAAERVAQPDHRGVLLAGVPVDQAMEDEKADEREEDHDRADGAATSQVE
jgi:hypothetical protein